MVLISLYPKFSNVGGAQKMCLSIHQGLMGFNYFKEGYISSFNNYNTIEPSYKHLINSKDYIKFHVYKFIKDYPNAIYLSHHRKTTSLLVLASKILNRKFKIIHVAHSEFTNLKYATFLPDLIIAVSNGVKINHESYFNTENVKVIYNGIATPLKKKKRSYNNKKIKILVSGRIIKGKQQLEIVKALRNKTPRNLELVFAGTGELYEELVFLTKDDHHFKVLGHITNMDDICLDSDYIMLYSLKEGLPLSLIEGTAYGLPILCNDVGGNLEILNKYNGFKIESLETLPSLLEKISTLSTVEYLKLSNKSLDTFKEKFDFEKMINSYYQYILGHVKG